MESKIVWNRDTTYYKRRAVIELRVMENGAITMLVMDVGPRGGTTSLVVGFTQDEWREIVASVEQEA